MQGETAGDCDRYEDERQQDRPDARSPARGRVPAVSPCLSHGPLLRTRAVAGGVWLTGDRVPCVPRDHLCDRPGPAPGRSSPIACSTTARLAWSRNSCGMPKSRTGVVDAGVAERLRDRRAAAAGAAVVLDRGDRTRSRLASSTSCGFTGFTQRGSTTVTPKPCASRRCATSIAVAAIDPMPTSSTSLPDRTEYVDLPDAVDRLDVREHLALRVPQHRRDVVDLDGLVQELLDPLAVPRGGEAQPGDELGQDDMSYMPLWVGPSSPVTPARSSTKVTPHLCSATSSSSWSKARLRNVA